MPDKSKPTPINKSITCKIGSDVITKTNIPNCDNATNKEKYEACQKCHPGPKSK